MNTTAHVAAFPSRQAVTNIPQAQGGSLDEQTCQHLAVRLNQPFRTIRRIVRKCGVVTNTCKEGLQDDGRVNKLPSLVSATR